MSELFREEALRKHHRRLLGDVTLTQPLPLTITTGFLTVVVLVLIVFLTFAQYSRKEQVTGYISPQHGVVRLHAPKGGVVVRLHADEGDLVSAGSPLVTIDAERITGSGISVIEEMLVSIDNQLREVTHLRDITLAQAVQRETRLQEQLDGLRAEKSALKIRKEMQAGLVSIRKKNFTRVRDLVVDGYVSSQDVVSTESELLSAEQLHAALVQQVASIESEANQLKLAIEHLPLETEEKLSNLATRRSDLELRELDLEDQDSVTILAPVSGTVSALQAILGASVGAQQTLLSLLPEGSSLEAHLFVPTRAIGFIEVGQEVRLLYDAFDYRRYGVQLGTVKEVSSAILTPSETLERIQRNEPTYMIRVDLEHQKFHTPDKTFDLHAGMMLRADVVLETRSLGSWLLNPLMAFRGRL